MSCLAPGFWVGTLLLAETALRAQTLWHENERDDGSPLAAPRWVSVST